MCACLWNGQSVIDYKCILSACVERQFAAVVVDCTSCTKQLYIDILFMYNMINRMRFPAVPVTHS